MRISCLLLGLLCFASPALAGVPERIESGTSKWQRVNENWTIDTEDVEVKGDQIRFWVERSATGHENAAWLSTSYRGKIRIRCSDFEQRIERLTHNAFGVAHIYRHQWQKIKPGYFAYTLASNFCHFTGVKGYTPEPLEYEWQKRLSLSLEAAIRKQPAPASSSSGRRSD